MSQTKMPIEGDVDLISKLPDVILQHILCFNIPTKLAISSSILSRRWRHVWCEVPSLSLDVDTLTAAASVNETLTRYTALRTKSFHLTIKPMVDNIPYMDRLIKFAMSHNVENLSLDFSWHFFEYKFPDFLYSSSSLKQLNIRFCSYSTIVPECTVSWTSLHKLSLTCSSLSDESMAKILSGCPILENLSLDFSDHYYEYKFPDFFYSTSSVKQLNITLNSYGKIVPKCTVSWTSLRKLSLTCDGLSDESMAKILSGCPVLEDLSLAFLRRHYDQYKLPYFFYSSSYIKQLNITLCSKRTIVPECTVSWTSLQKLSFRYCSLSDESMAKILSGCPILEKLKLYHCDGTLNVLDLRESPRLRTLEVIRNMRVPGPRQIVAPHIHYLRLYDPQLSCTLVDVSSLTEARMEISCVSLNSDSKANFLQAMVLKMLDKLQNVEKLTLGRNFIQILSLAEIRGVHFPMLKVKALTLDIKMSQYVIPGIERLLENSPELEKLTVGGKPRFRMHAKFLDKYLKLQGFNVNKCWRSKKGATWGEHCVDVESEHVALVELMLINRTEKLDKVIVLLNERYLKFKTEDLIATLCHNNNVTIVLFSTQDW